MNQYTIPWVSGRVAILSDPHINSYVRAGDDFVTAHGLEPVLDDNLDAIMIAGDLTDGPALPWMRGLNYLTNACTCSCLKLLGAKS